MNKMQNNQRIFPLIESYPPVQKNNSTIQPTVFSFISIFHNQNPPSQR